MTPETKIYRVSEAFSMQPTSWAIGMKCRSGFTLTRIERGEIYDTGDPFDVYVGYDSNNNKAFEIRVKAATVEYLM